MAICASLDIDQNPKEESLRKSVTHTPTPVCTGEDAEKIAKEIKEGTPLTPERETILDKADEIFRNSGSVFRINRKLK